MKAAAAHGRGAPSSPKDRAKTLQEEVDGSSKKTSWPLLLPPPWPCSVPPIWSAAGTVVRSASPLALPGPVATSIGAGSCEPLALSPDSSETLAFLLLLSVVLGGVDGPGGAAPPGGVVGAGVFGAGVSRAAVAASGVLGASGPVTMEKLLGDPGAAVPPCPPVAPVGGGGGGGR